MYNHLKDQQVADYFEDEYRSPIYIDDIATIIVRLSCMTNHKLLGTGLPLVLNCGGPERLSRAEFAEKVADHFGFKKGVIHRKSAKCRYAVGTDPCLPAGRKVPT